MVSFLAVLLLVLSFASASTIRRQAPGFQSIPAKGKADKTFSNGKPALIGEPALSGETPPDIYGARSIDIPFYRLYHGNMNFFPTGQLNTKDSNTDKWTPAGIDSASQSACGIPDNAFFDSKVAIHPYFLKYADLSRYCMQDVCISFWKEDGSSDMILKVTDICSTDPSDPTHCATPADIKIDRAKAQVMEGFGNQPLDTVPGLQGNQYPTQTWWFFTKCWADALVQPAYKDNNWFATPALPNNKDWMLGQAMQQYTNNQKSYASKGWPLYANGGYNTTRVMEPISDWDPNAPLLAWSPVAGGKGWANLTGGTTANTQLSPSPAAQDVSTTSSTQPVNGAPPAAVVSSRPSSSSSAPSSTETDAENVQDECEL